MSIANKVRGIVTQAAASTLGGGYAQMYDGSIRRFEQGVCELEKRNAKGRCTHVRYRFADNSTLTMKWSDTYGYNWIVN